MNALRIPSRRSALSLSHLPPCKFVKPYRFSVSYPTTQARLRSTTESLPRIARTSFWTSMVPRFLRRGGSQSIGPHQHQQPASSTEWNPATFYIIIFTLIGSQAIQMLLLRKDFENYNRKADAKIQLLNEVIQRVKNGEKVDVEKLLGTGDESKEREWEEVLQEIEEEDSLWRQKAGRSSQPTPEKNSKSEDSAAKSTKDASNQPQNPQASNDSVDKSAKVVRFF